VPGPVLWSDLGRRPYVDVWRLQRALVEPLKRGEGPDRLLLVEHEPVVTLGRSAEEEHVLVGRAGLTERGIELHRVERGGDVTYHGPGQLVGYPILDLRRHRKDVRWYSESLTEVMVRALARLGVVATARGGRDTGVWLADTRSREKIGMLGVRVERWVAYHGFALNISADLTPFDLIVPCGLPGVTTTSAEAALGRDVPMSEARQAVVAAFADVFGVVLQRADSSQLEAVA